MTFRPPKKPLLTLDANLVQDDLPLEVVPKIFVGSIHSAFNLILNASRLPVTFPKQFTYLSVEIRDKGESNILSCIPTTNIFIEAAIEEGGVLVHCFGGKSRSPAFIAAYLMSSQNLSFDEAYGRIKAARPTVDINPGFECQLRAYAAGNYDVYVAQQLLLRTRIRALYQLKGNEAFLGAPEAKASDRIASTQSRLNRVAHGAGYTKHDDDPDKVADNGVGHSPDHTLVATPGGPSASSGSGGASRASFSQSGHKRSWDEKSGGGGVGSSGGGGADTKEDDGMLLGGGGGCGPMEIVRAMSNDMEESAAIRDLERQARLETMGATTGSLNLLGADSNSSHSSGGSGNVAGVAYRTSSSSMHITTEPAPSNGSTAKTPRASKGRVNRGGRSLSADVEAKTPTCRLSRPGANWVRVIPPLRGLEREFKCSWCNIALFSLANVIRVDLNVLPLLDSVPKAEEKSSSGSGLFGAARSPRGESLDSPSGRDANNNHSLSFSRSAHGGTVTSGSGSFPEMGPPTPRSRAAASNNSFSELSVPMVISQTPRVMVTPRDTAAGGGGGGGAFPPIISTSSNNLNSNSFRQPQQQQHQNYSSNNNNTVGETKGHSPRGGGGVSFALQTASASPPSGSQDVEMDIDDDPHSDADPSDNASPKYMYSAPLKSSRAGGGGGGGAKGFSFDIPMINLDASIGGGGAASPPDNKNSPPASKSSEVPSSARSNTGGMSARSSAGYGSSGAQAASSVLSPTSARSSPKVSARGPYDGSPGGALSARKAAQQQQHDVSFASDSKHSGGGQGSSLMAKSFGHAPPSYGSTLPLIHPNSTSSRPSSANTSTSLFSYSNNSNSNSLSHSGPLYDDSPRIQIPAHRMHETFSPRNGGGGGQVRPQSAEKRRWLARVNLLRGEGDQKVAKMAEDDESASQLGQYGEGSDSKYFYIEYLDWMGKDLFRHGAEAGDIACFNCKNAVGAYIWKPSVRLTLNNKLEAPLFKIHKHVVHQTDWVFDATPRSTPRLEDGSGGGGGGGEQQQMQMQHGN